MNNSTGKRTGLFLALSAGMMLSTACASRQYIEIPQAGEEAPANIVRTGPAGLKYLNLNPRVREIRYQHFTILNPDDGRFLVPVTKNAGNIAQWDISCAPPDFIFRAAVLRSRMKEPAFDAEELQQLYKTNYVADRKVIRYESRVENRDGIPTVIFTARGRIPDNGKIFLVEGFCCIDPQAPDYVIEAIVYRCGFENDIANPETKELGDLFLKSVLISK